MRCRSIAENAAALRRQARTLSDSCKRTAKLTFSLIGRVAGFVFASEAAMHFFDWTIRDEEDD